MSEVLQFPEPAVFDFVEPQLLADFFNQFKDQTDHIPGASNILGSEVFALDAITVRPHILKAAKVILDPVKEHLASYLDIAAESFEYNEINFSRVTVLPGMPYIKTAQEWHSDGDSFLACRVDSEDGSEHLSGDITQDFIDEMIDIGAIDDPADFDLETVGDAMEEERYSDQALQEMGLSWIQPPDGSAYLLTKNHIHRSPSNKRAIPRTRDSFQVIFSRR